MQFEIRQLRAHLAQQDLDLAAEREAALQAPHVLSQPRSRYKVVEAGTWAEETAGESIVVELRPSQGEPLRLQSPKNSSLTSLQVSTQRGLDIGFQELGHSQVCAFYLARPATCGGTPKSVSSELPLRAQEEHLARDLDTKVFKSSKATERPIVN